MSDYTIIYPPTISWNEPIFQRPHQLMLEFARQGELAILANVVDDGKGTYWHAHENLVIANDLFATLADATIRERMNGTKVVLWVTYTETMKLRDKIKPDVIIFDYIDEATDEFSQWENGLIESMDIANHIFVTADRLYELTTQNFPNKTSLLKNAADIHSFLKKPEATVPMDIQSINHHYNRTIGFYGSLQSWVDYNIIKGIAELRKDWAVVLIGPDYYQNNVCRDVDNIYFLGVRNYFSLPNYAYSFDVGIIPFEIRNLTHSTNPIKMYEYLATGLPVVATQMRECMGLEPAVRIANNAEEFVTQIEKAIEERDNTVDACRKIAIDNSWTVRVKDAIKIIGGINK